MDKEPFNRLIDLAVANGIATVHKGDVGHVSVREDTAMAEEQAVEALHAFLKDRGAAPPDIKETAQLLGMPLSLVRRAMAVLVDNGTAYRVTPDLYYIQTCIDDFKQKVVDLCAAGEGASLGDIRDAFGIGRRATVEVLDAFDAEEFTVRVDDRRYIKSS